MKNKKKIFRYIFVCVMFVIMVVSCYKIITTYSRLKKADEVYEKLQNEFVQIVDDVDETYGSEYEMETEPATDESSSSETSAVTDTDAVTSTEPATTEKETDPPKPAPKPTKIKVNFDALLKENNDVVGWIYSAGTPISYPVMQAEDNDTYLRADIYKNYLVSGTLFVDFRNREICEDRNYIIYGHHMKNGTMFGSLLYYKDQSYYNAHPTIQYLTPNGNYTIRIVAGGVIHMNDIIYYPNPPKAEFEKYLEDLLNNSTFDSGLTFEKDDKLITLSTCSYDFDGARYVLVGKLEPSK